MNYEKHPLNIYPELEKETDDYKDLYESLSNEYDKSNPIVLYEDKIIDGWNRYLICKELDVTPTFRSINKPYLEVLLWVKGNNSRRNLTPDARTAIFTKFSLMELEYAAEQERKRKISESMKGNNNPKKEKTDHVQIAQDLLLDKPEEKTDVPQRGGTSVFNKPEEKKHVTRDKIAEEAKVGKHKAQDIINIVKNNPKLADEIIAGKTTIADIKKEEKKQKQKEEHDKLKERENLPIVDKYDVIVIDPPWQMEKIEREVAPNQIGFDYPTMDIDAIKKMEIPAQDTCHLFMWITQKYLPLGFSILEAWGFKYVFTMVWHKNGGFQPFNLPMYNCEFVLYGRKGSPMFVDLKQFPTCFKADRTGHSEKPNEFYDLLRRVTAGKRLDMFNRRKIDGFDTWGNESI
jgi:N6-adenosine-specific RNA methylase IME4